MDVAEIVDALLVTGAVTVWPCPEDEAGPTAAAVGRVIEDTKPFRLGDPDDLTDNERRMALADILTARGNGHPVIVFSEGPPQAFCRSVGLETAPWDLNINELVAGDELARYLLADTAALSWAGVRPRVESPVYLTPIERALATAFDRAGIPYRVQVALPGARADFLIGDCLIVECDGREWHSPSKDAQRDDRLAGLGYRTLRLSGSRIIREPDRCVDDVLRALSEVMAGAVATAPQADPHATESQRRAIGHGCGPAIVAAPAGSGKTRVIVGRIQQLVASGVPAQEICAISFTNTAVDEMRGRLTGPAAKAELTTLHRLARRIADGARGARAVAGSNGSPSLEDIVSSCLGPGEMGSDPAAARTEWFEAIESFRQSMEVPSERGLPLANGVPVSPERFLEVHSAVEDAMLEEGVTDFDGMILDAIRALARDPRLHNEWSARFSHWIVDEFQDLPPSKVALVRLLASPSRNLFVVGDDDQTIYGFAGAHPRTFIDVLPDAWPDTERYVLEENFRNPPDVVRAAGHLISRNQQRVKKSVSPRGRSTVSRPLTVSIDAAYEAVGLNLVRSALGRGVPPHEIALLFRTKAMAVPVEAALAAAGIPHIPCSDAAVFNSNFVKPMRAWLRICGGTPTNNDFKSALWFPPLYLKGEDYAAVGRAQNAETFIRSGVEDGWEHITEPSRSEFIHDQLTDFVKRIDVGRAAGPVPSAIVQALRLDEALALARVDEKRTESRSIRRDATPDFVAAEVFLRFVSNFDSVAALEEWIDSKGRKSGPGRAMASRSAEAVEGHVQLMSIHAAKGQEFQVVGVLGPMDGMPDSRAETELEKEEERRVAYVAATRAADELHFCASAQFGHELLAGDASPVAAPISAPAAPASVPAPVSVTSPGREILGYVDLAIEGEGEDLLAWTRRQNDHLVHRRGHKGAPEVAQVLESLRSAMTSARARQGLEVLRPDVVAAYTRFGNLFIL